MKTGGYAAHLASLKAPTTPPVPVAPADHLRLFGTTADVVLAHREKITAGVPGCTCGKSYPTDSHSYCAVLHAQHVAIEAVTHVLDAAVAAIRADLDAYERDPEAVERWQS
ncbi:hypothetical protein GCM10023063_19360 [Arthrobacter methylotrophus]|uniref:Uncharacterized protein n=1 Tax=Arthrobacter methylotrophus TaxID=121291 RepID=A0ABV5UP98_9MICC